MPRQMVKAPQIGQPVVLTETLVKMEEEDGKTVRLPQQHGRVVELLGSRSPIAGHMNTTVRMATPWGTVIRTGTFHIRTMTDCDLEKLKETEEAQKVQQPDEPVYAGLWPPPENLATKP